MWISELIERKKNEIEKYIPSNKDSLFNEKIDDALEPNF